MSRYCGTCRCTLLHEVTWYNNDTVPRNYQPRKINTRSTIPGIPANIWDRLCCSAVLLRTARVKTHQFIAFACVEVKSFLINVSWNPKHWSYLLKTESRQDAFSGGVVVVPRVVTRTTPGNASHDKVGIRIILLLFGFQSQGMEWYFDNVGIYLPPNDDFMSGALWFWFGNVMRLYICCASLVVDVLGVYSAENMIGMSPATENFGPWWRHQMETFSALLALCAGNSPVNSPHKGQWRGALMFSLICARIKGWVNNREAGDLRRYCAHYDVIVMQKISEFVCWGKWPQKIKHRHTHARTHTHITQHDATSPGSMGNFGWILLGKRQWVWPVNGNFDFDH